MGDIKSVKDRDIGLIPVGVDDVMVVMPGGRSYRIGFGDWLTISDYSHKYGKSLNQVMNWISRGLIGAEDVLLIPELNGLRLIRDKTYDVRSYVRKGGESA